MVDFYVIGFLPRTLVLPPVLLLIGALVCWVLAQRYPRIGLRMLGVCLAGLLILALPITPALLFAALESGIALGRPDAGESGQALPAPQAIVILGGDVSYGRVGGAVFGGAQLGSLSLERVRAGVALQRRIGLPILLTGGPFRAGSVSVSVLMRQSLESDFKAQAQWVEPRSANTWENAEFTAAMLGREGISSVYVVTHSFHMRRALLAFRHFGITVWPAPVNLTASGGLSLEMLQPSVTAWFNSYLALHEWAGCAVYALRG